VRVLLADDHPLVIEGLRNILEAHGIQVVGVARDGLEALALARAVRPDVVLMDVRMPRCDGLTATRLIKAELPDVRIVILTVSADESDLFEAVKSGAHGYLLKNMEADALIEALEDAGRDIPPFAPGLASRLLDEFSHLAGLVPGGVGAGSAAPEGRPAGSPDRTESAVRAEGVADRDEPLTPRQREVLALVADGLGYKEIARRICLSPRTVKYHMAEIMRKLHLDNRAQVLAWAGRAGLGDPGGGQTEA